MPHWEETCAIYDHKRTELDELNQAVQEAEKRRDAILSDIECRKRRENEVVFINCVFLLIFTVDDYFGKKANRVPIAFFCCKGVRSYYRA